MSNENGQSSAPSASRCYPHDVFEDMESRLTKEEHRDPRVVVVSECHDGQYSWAELSNCGTTGDTTLTGVVLDCIEKAICSGQMAGTVTVDGIVYAFVFGRYRG